MSYPDEKDIEFPVTLEEYDLAIHQADNLDLTKGRITSLLMLLISQHCPIEKPSEADIARMVGGINDLIDESFHDCMREVNNIISNYDDGYKDSVQFDYNAAIGRA